MDESHDPHLILTEFNWGKVSTVFLGINHNWNFDETPILFETMIFGGGELNKTVFRYKTWDEALTTHNILCEVLSRIEQYN